MDQLYDFAGVGVTLSAGFGVDFAVVQCYLEAAFTTADEGDGFQLIAEFGYEFSRQTDGSWSVMSFLAVEDLDFHVAAPYGVFMLNTARVGPGVNHPARRLHNACSLSCRLFAPPRSLCYS